MTRRSALLILEAVELLTSNRDLDRFRASSGDVVLIPTMGALHAGHESLVRKGVELARGRGICMVWVFVNPTQFNDPADYARYPKTLQADVDLCTRAGAAAVFAPSAPDIYPPNQQIPVPSLPEQATRPGLEDAHRPGHFAGVCQVVLRFFDLIRPRCAVFGEKDWQQLQVVRAMTKRDRPEIEIVGMPTVREPDGLAMSSRNRFLAPGDRQKALAISRALVGAGRVKTPAEAEAAMRSTLRDAGVEPEYAVVRDAATLLAPATGALRALIAARLGAVRLIDNALWPSI